MRKTWSCAAVSFWVLLGVAAAQSKEAAPQPDKTPTPLKVQLVVANFLGERKLTSLPYTLSVNADEPRATKLRMGIEVPVSLGQDKAIQYRTVGTNIDCSAEKLQDGRFKLWLAVERSSVYPERSSSEEGPAGAPLNYLPLFRSFSSNVSVILRDGETIEYSAATDPVTGEVLKVSATLTVSK